MSKGTSPASPIPSLQHARARVGVEPLESRRLLSAAAALDLNNRLLEFDTAASGTITRTVEITGLGSGESILAIDYRPATGGLYGLSSGSRLYSINPITGAATQVGSDFAFPLQGDSFDIDFNPTVDRIRVVSNTDQNFRLNPVTGAVVDGDPVTAGVQGDSELAYATGDANEGDDPVIVGAAYTNNFSGTTSTTLFAIDSASNALATIGGVAGTPTPNLGQLFTIGDLGVNIGKRSALDIVTEGGTNIAYMVPQADNDPQLYRVDLTTGAATSQGMVGTVFGAVVLDFAIAPPRAVAIALTTKNELLAFFANDPTNILRKTKIRGLDAGENILCIDFRPANGTLYGVSSADVLYTINPKSGRTTAVGSTFGLALSGNSFGIDFNPAVDRIRLVSNTDQNLRLNPDTGVVVDGDAVMGGLQGDAALAYDGADANTGADPFVTAAAYTGNDTDAATPTTLYGIDTGLNTLVRQGSVAGAPTSPNAGTLFTVGALGANYISRSGFDISTNNGIDTAFAALQVDGQVRAGIYRINLATGAATRLGSIGGNRAIAGLAMVTV